MKQWIGNFKGDEMGWNMSVFRKRLLVILPMVIIFILVLIFIGGSSQNGRQGQNKDMTERMFDYYYSGEWKNIKVLFLKGLSYLPTEKIYTLITPDVSLEGFENNQDTESPHLYKEVVGMFSREDPENIVVQLEEFSQKPLHKLEDREIYRWFRRQDPIVLSGLDKFSLKNEYDLNKPYCPIEWRYDISATFESLRIIGKYLDYLFINGKYELLLRKTDNILAYITVLYNYSDISHNNFLMVSGINKKVWKTLFNMYHSSPEYREEIMDLHDKTISAMPEKDIFLYLDKQFEAIYRMVNNNTYQYNGDIRDLRFEYGLFLIKRIRKLLTFKGFTFEEDIQKLNQYTAELINGKIDAHTFSKKIKPVERSFFPAMQLRPSVLATAGHFLNVYAYLNIMETVFSGEPAPDPFGGYIEIIRSEDTVKYISHREDFNKDAENIVFEYKYEIEGME